MADEQNSANEPESGGTAPEPGAAAPAQPAAAPPADEVAPPLPMVTMEIPTEPEFKGAEPGGEIRVPTDAGAIEIREGDAGTNAE